METDLDESTNIQFRVTFSTHNRCQVDIQYLSSIQRHTLIEPGLFLWQQQKQVLSLIL